MDRPRRYIQGCYARTGTDHKFRVQAHATSNLKNTTVGEAIERDDAIKDTGTVREKTCGMNEPRVNFVKPSAREFSRANLVTPVIRHRVVRPPGSITVLNEGGVEASSTFTVVNACIHSVLKG